MADLAADLRRHLANEPISGQALGRHGAPSGNGSAAIRRRAPRSVCWRWPWWWCLNLYSKLFDEQQATAQALTTASKERDLKSDALLQIKHEQQATQTALEQVSQEKEATTAALVTAQQALDDLQVKTEEVKRQAYSASIHAAGAAVGSGNTTEARRRLNDCPEELRDWEWGISTWRAIKACRRSRGMRIWCGPSPGTPLARALCRALRTTHFASGMRPRGQACRRLRGMRAG